MKENIYIVSDFFIDEYVGGAELSTSSLISYCDKECIEVKSRQVTLDMLSNNRESTWIFTNFSLLNPQLIGYIAENLVNYHIWIVTLAYMLPKKFLLIIKFRSIQIII